MVKKGEMMQSEVLAVLKQAGAALSAYDVLHKLREKHPKIAPPTVYRALNALIEKGGVHRIESLNAFIACRGEGTQKTAIMSICDDCGSVEESSAPEVYDSLSCYLGKHGFEAQRHVIEVHGVCSSCGSADTPS